MPAIEISANLLVLHRIKACEDGIGSFAVSLNAASAGQTGLHHPDNSGRNCDRRQNIQFGAAGIVK